MRLILTLWRLTKENRADKATEKPQKESGFLEIITLSEEGEKKKAWQQLS